jgi:twitching motility two-component system response regulator PilH
MGHKILAIDDSQTVRQFITRSLSSHSADYEVILAKNGKEGITKAKSELPDLILLDFGLPDLKGDQVCQQLADDEATRDLAIILMKSSASEGRKAVTTFPNIKRTITKPFSLELLCASVGTILRELPASKPRSAASAASPPAAHGQVVFSGNSAYFPLCEALLALQQDQLTGVLQLELSGASLELYVASGKARLVTTRSAEYYLEQSRSQPTWSQTSLLEAAQKSQKKTGQPLYLTLAEKQEIPEHEAITECQRVGLQLFSQVWISGRVPFEFRSLAKLPSFAEHVPAAYGTLDEFAMETLRLIGPDCLYAIVWGDPTDIPTFTRDGYDRIQMIPLKEAELRFASWVSSSLSMEDIAEHMSMPLEKAQEILFVFLTMRIMDCWPKSSFRKPIRATKIIG